MTSKTNKEKSQEAKFPEIFCAYAYMQNLLKFYCINHTYKSIQSQFKNQKSYAKIRQRTDCHVCIH